jgi:dihydropteroate synthase
MGVLNLGGMIGSPNETVARGLDLVAEGADVLDVSGVDGTFAETEAAGVIAALAGAVRVSIHTTDPAVAVAGIEAGATLVNDMSARLWPVAAEAGAGWIAVHGSEPIDPTERDIVSAVTAELVRRAAAALDGGVDEVWIDPGLGFGKSLAQSITLLARLDELVATGLPVATATSRKRFVGALLAASDARAAEPSLPGLVAPSLVESADETVTTPADDRIEGSLATATYALLHGASLIRAHDVRATANAVRLLTVEVAA